MLLFKVIAFIKIIIANVLEEIAKLLSSKNMEELIELISDYVEINDKLEVKVIQQRINLTQHILSSQHWKNLIQLRKSN
jgi:septum formation topological specificity factor MinE